MDANFTEQYRLAMESKDALKVKTCVCTIAAVIMAVLSFFPVPGMALAIVSAAMCVCVYGICFNEMNDGIVSLFQKNPSNDSINILALTAALIQSVYLIFADSEKPRFFSWIIFLSVAISMFMKFLFVKEIIENLNLIRQNKTYLVETADVDFKKRYISKVCMVNPVVKFPDVVDATYEDDPSEKNNNRFVPAVCIACVVISIAAFIIRGADTAFMSLAALMSIAACFTGEMAFVMPYIAAQKKLRRLGSVLLGSNSIERLKKINTLAVEDSDLFPSEYAAIVNVRFFRKKYVSKSLEYAAVMLDEINSPVASSLFEILDCDYDLLPNITSLRCIQDYGLSGVVNGENVLLGNRNLLLSHNIAPLSQEQEATLLTMNRSLFYLAVNNEVVAIILAQYSPDPELQKIVERVGENFNIIVETMDCNINEYMVQKRYNLKNTHVIVTDTEESYKMYQVKKKLAKSKETPVMITTRNAIGILSSVEKAKKLSRVLELSILTKFISVLAGLVLTAIAVLAVPMTLSPLWVLVFNVLWMIPIIWISFFGD